MLQAANITPWLQALFDEVEVGNEDTYPSADEVEKVLTQIAELLEKGNETAPDDIRPVWLRATASFVADRSPRGGPLRHRGTSRRMTCAA